MFDSDSFDTDSFSSVSFDFGQAVSNLHTIAPAERIIIDQAETRSYFDES